jgi:hypothetical protein
LPAKAILPLALVLILASCGGSGGSTRKPTQEIRGRGFTVEVPAGWTVRRTGSAVGARKGDALVSVTIFPLVKPYDPAKFAAVARELDGVAAKLAAQAGHTLTERTTTTVDGRKVRAYRYNGVRVGFVLDGRLEYQLLCLAPDGGDPDGACGELFGSFSMT